MIHDINHAKFEQLTKLTNRSFMANWSDLLASQADYPCQKSSNLSLSGSPAWLSCLVEDFCSSREELIYMCVCIGQIYSERVVIFKKIDLFHIILPFYLIPSFLGIVLVWFSISLI